MDLDGAMNEPFLVALKLAYEEFWGFVLQASIRSIFFVMQTHVWEPSEEISF